MDKDHSLSVTWDRHSNYTPITETSYSEILCIISSRQNSGLETMSLSWLQCYHVINETTLNFTISRKRVEKKICFSNDSSFLITIKKSWFLKTISREWMFVEVHHLNLDLNAIIQDNLISNEIVKLMSSSRESHWVFPVEIVIILESASIRNDVTSWNDFLLLDRQYILTLFLYLKFSFSQSYFSDFFSIDCYDHYNSKSITIFELQEKKRIFLFQLQFFLSDSNVVWKSSEADDHDLFSLFCENDGELQFSLFLIIVYTLVISISYIRFNYLTHEIFMIQSCLKFWYYRIFLIHLKSIFVFEAGTKLTRMFQIRFFQEKTVFDV